MRDTRKRDCLADLRQRILTMEIAPGADLDEAALAQLYDLSRTPLREVLQRLAGDGYVTLAENRGAQVASMDLVGLRRFLQTAPLIYCAVARLATTGRTAEQLGALKAVQKRLARAVSALDAPTIALQNHRFHELIGEMAANDYLMPSLRRLLIDHTRLGQSFHGPASGAEAAALRQASQQHEAMIAALEARDAEALVGLTLAHWEQSRERIERFVRPDPLPRDVPGFAAARRAG